MSREEVTDAMVRADVVVMPSRYEGLPYVALEAQLLGKPLVVTRVDGLKDVVIDGGTGFVVDLDDDSAMAQRIRQLVRDPASAAQMGERGRQRVREHFNIRTNILGVERVYTDVAQAARL